MHAYIINLDSAAERWEFVSKNFLKTGISFSRVSGVLGRDLTFPNPLYSKVGFTLRHGHRTNHGAIGCYLSHLKCWQMVANSAHDHAIIAEDDALPNKDLRAIVERAIEFDQTWDILRLSGFHDAHPKPYAKLDGDHELCVCMTRLCGTGAYMIKRQAASILAETLNPMRLPIDHAIDREWAFNLRSAAVMPLPVAQTTHVFNSQCQGKKHAKYPWFLRYLTVFPYRAWTETSRMVHRRRQYKLACQQVAAHHPRSLSMRRAG